jgi:hypothetical protein
VDAPAADVSWLDVDHPTPVDAPGARHQALWLVGRDLDGQARFDGGEDDRGVSTDPHATLDVIVAPDEPPPLALLAAIRARLGAAPSSYASRALAHRGEDLQRRITLVQRQGRMWPIAAHADLQVHGPLFVEMRGADALDRVERIGLSEPCARIVGPVDAPLFEALGQRADPESIAFADRAAETRWQSEIMGFGAE